MSYYMKKIVSERRERGCVLYEVEWENLDYTTWESRKKIYSTHNQHLIDEWRYETRKRSRSSTEEETKSKEDEELIEEEKPNKRRRYKIRRYNSNKSLRKEIYDKQKGLCNCCRKAIMRDGNHYIADIDHIKPKQLKKECDFSDAIVESYDNKHMICTECHRIKNNSIDKLVIDAYKCGDRYSHSQIIEMLREKYLKCK